MVGKSSKDLPNGFSMKWGLLTTYIHLDDPPSSPRNIGIHHDFSQVFGDVFLIPKSTDQCPWKGLNSAFTRNSFEQVIFVKFSIT